jgi:hypothetical protein
MHLIIKFAVIFLEALFAVGVIGSAIVVILTSIEDIGEIMSSDEPAGGPVHSQPQAAD